MESCHRLAWATFSRGCDLQAAVYTARAGKGSQQRIKARTCHAPARRLARTTISLGPDEGILFGLRAIRRVLNPIPTLLCQGWTISGSSTARETSDACEICRKRCAARSAQPYQPQPTEGVLYGLCAIRYPSANLRGGHESSSSNVPCMRLSEDTSLGSASVANDVFAGLQRPYYVHGLSLCRKICALSTIKEALTAGLWRRKQSQPATLSAGHSGGPTYKRAALDAVGHVPQGGPWIQSSDEGCIAKYSHG